MRATALTVAKVNASAYPRTLSGRESTSMSRIAPVIFRAPLGRHVTRQQGGRDTSPITSASDMPPGPPIFPFVFKYLVLGKCRYRTARNIVVRSNRRKRDTPAPRAVPDRRRGQRPRTAADESR
jgi:hypothetical protein